MTGTDWQKKLADPQFLGSVDKAVNQFVIFGHKDLAFTLSKKLNSLLNKYDFVNNQPDLYKKYKKLIILCQWLSLSLLSETEIVGLFQSDAREGFSNEDILLESEMRIRLLTMMFDGRDSFKGKIRKALEENEQILTAHSIILHTKPVQPTIGNWIKSYNEVLGTGVIDNLKLSKFYIENQNIKQLNNNEKKVIKRIFDFYELMKYSSYHAKGMEERIGIDDPGREGTIINGVLEKFDPRSIKETEKLSRLINDSGKEEISGMSDETKAAISKNLEQIKKLYKGDKQQEQAIADLIKNLSGQSAVQSLFQAVNEGNTNKTIAILRLLAKEKKLVEIVSASGQLRSMFQGYLEAQYGKEITEKFNQDPKQIPFIFCFLQFILNDKLDLSDQESARQAVHIANYSAAAGDDQYLKMAYADESTGRFEWAEVVKGQDGLAIKR